MFIVVVENEFVSALLNLFQSAENRVFLKLIIGFKQKSVGAIFVRVVLSPNKLAFCNCLRYKIAYANQLENEYESNAIFISSTSRMGRRKSSSGACAAGQNARTHARFSRD